MPTIILLVLRDNPSFFGLVVSSVAMETPCKEAEELRGNQNACCKLCKTTRSPIPCAAIEPATRSQAFQTSFYTIPLQSRDVPLQDLPRPTAPCSSPAFCTGSQGWILCVCVSNHQITLISSILLRYLAINIMESSEILRSKISKHEVLQEYWDRK